MDDLNAVELEGGNQAEALRMSSVELTLPSWNKMPFWMVSEGRDPSSMGSMNLLKVDRKSLLSNMDCWREAL